MPKEKSYTQEQLQLDYLNKTEWNNGKVPLVDDPPKIPEWVVPCHGEIYDG